MLESFIVVLSLAFIATVVASVLVVEFMTGTEDGINSVALAFKFAFRYTSVSILFCLSSTITGGVFVPVTYLLSS